jgi:hypothetical protein
MGKDALKSITALFIKLDQRSYSAADQGKVEIILGRGFKFSGTV